MMDLRTIAFLLGVSSVAAGMFIASPAASRHCLAKETDLSAAIEPSAAASDRVSRGVTRMIAEPSRIQLAAGPAAQQLLITAQGPQGEWDVTAESQFRSTNPQVATVTSSGLVRVHHEGNCEIQVSFGNHRETISIHGMLPPRGRQVYFSRDVVPILTKLDCNSGGCHGKATGQNGFSLSLLGYEPHADFESIAREARGRRISVAQPEQSLLLQKATGFIPHGGGARLEVGGDDYRMLLQWIRSGAIPPTLDESPLVDVHGSGDRVTFPTTTAAVLSSDASLSSDAAHQHDDSRRTSAFVEPDPIVTRVTVTPERRVLSPSARQQLLVTAHFSDGTSRDVTRQAVYQSNEPEIADVDAEGVIRAERRGGLFAVMVRYGDEFSVFQGTIPFVSENPPRESVWEELQKRSSQHPLDRHLLATWQRLGIEPSLPIDEGAFLRRITLDVCGRLPTEGELAEYLADDRADKKERLIDRLLEDEGYASYFALKWADILQNRGRGYGTQHQRAGTTLLAAWLRDVISENVPYDQFVTQLITATGSQQANPPTLWYRTVRSQQDYVESVSQVFLGVRLQCAQCHHHPAEKLSQEDYYSLAAVFARVGRKGGFADAEVPTNEVLYVAMEGQTVHPRTGKLLAPRPLGGAPFDVTRYDDPRQHFARWLTTPENPYFARTMANRVWGHFFGRGIIHPIDDARSSNPPSNPELLEELTREFISSGYDVRHLIRLCVTSYAYQLSSQPTDSNREDQQSFARFYPRRLPAEVLLDALSDVLEVPTRFPAAGGAFPLGTRAIDLPDEAVPSNFLDVFGRPARSTSCECERVDAPSLGQALELISSSLIQEKLTAPTGLAAQLAENDRSHGENIHALYARCFARAPQPNEEEVALNYLTSEESRHVAYQSLLWSLLATNEFLFTH